MRNAGFDGNVEVQLVPQIADAASSVLGEPERNTWRGLSGAAGGAERSVVPMQADRECTNGDRANHGRMISGDGRTLSAHNAPMTTK